MEIIVAGSAILISIGLFLIARELHLIGYMIWEHMRDDLKLLDK